METIMNTTLINLTPHTISIHGADGVVVVLPSAGLARVSETRAPRASLVLPGGEVIPVTSPSFGEVTGLPEPVEGTVFVVSALVRAALPDRGDLASPGPLVRDAGGNPLGCQGLSM